MEKLLWVLICRDVEYEQEEVLGAYIYIYTREFYKLARLKKEKGFGQRKE
jgi:hypothetical protein